MPIRPENCATLEAVIGKVESCDGGWNVGLMPDNSTWLTVRKDGGFVEPKVGEIITIVPPRVLSIRSRP